MRFEHRPLTGASDWIERQRTLWERKFDVVEQYLGERTNDRMDEQWAIQPRPKRS